MEELKRKRGRVKANITRIENYLKNLNKDALDYNELLIRESLLINAFNEFGRVHELICEKVEKDEDIEAQADEMLAIENKYIACHSQFRSLIQSRLASQGANDSANAGFQHSSTSPASHSVKINLPSMKIPIFSGNYGEWRTFIDLFNASVDNDVTLANSQKFVYLKSFLKDEPLSIISQLAISEDNYKRALNILKDRYDKKMPVVNHHINGLLQVQVAKGMNGLRDFLYQIKQHINALEALEVQVMGTWDLLLINVFSNKIDRSLRNDFELSRDQAGLPSLSEFFEFLDKRAIAWESSQNINIKGESKVDFKPRHNHSSSYQVSNFVGSNIHCLFCKGDNHNIFRCSRFKNVSIGNKRDFVIKNKLCFNCLNKGHGVSQCQRDRCRSCSGKHHILLHENKSVTPRVIPNTGTGNGNENISDSQVLETHDSEVVQQTATCTSYTTTEFSGQCLRSPNNGQVLLATARFYLRSEEGRRLEVRGLLDSGSQTSFITSSVVKLLGCKTIKTSFKILGISQTSNNVSKMVKVEVESKVPGHGNFSVSCGVLDKITCDLPQQNIESSWFNLPLDIVLADDNYHSTGKIDMLIGGDLYFQLLLPQIRHLGSNMPVLQSTKLGWVLGGHIKANDKNNVSNLSVVFCSTVNSDINSLIPKFWQLEDISGKRVLTAEDKIVERRFCETTKRNEQGQFIVDLPLKDEVSNLNLGESFEFAKQRFLSLEKRLQKDKDIFVQYKDFIDEYVNLGHGSYIELSSTSRDSLKRYFLPHHCVIKEAAISTKLRVVFDASMKTSSGRSLNEMMYKGPTVQPELFDIVCRFRVFKFVFISDIIKMYRQIVVNSAHQHLQNIIWRDDPKDRLKCIQLHTVTYGTSAAPYLATRCLVQLAEENMSSHPLASQALLEQTYVDDILGGKNSKSELRQLQEELIKLLGSAGLSLHKWVFNFIENGNNNDVNEINIKVDESLTKVLGISWNALSDNFNICGIVYKGNAVPTKRNVLAHIAGLFDPLGFIGPLVILGKMLMQKIWAAKLDWDLELTSDLQEEWFKFAGNVSMLKDLEIPRLLYDGNKEILSFELHGFSDASTKAYGTCFYLRTIFLDKSVSCRLICSKSRVAPLKLITLPRLELCGCLLMARLCHKLVSTFNIKFSRVILWTDSKIVLSWLKGSPDRWTTFVSHRVSEIQELTTNFQWYHVSSSENPADHISRGLDTLTLVNCNQWWNGPGFIYFSDLNFEEDTSEVIVDLPEIKVSHVVVNDFSETMEILSKFSNFRHLQRTIAFCLRFSNNCLKDREKLKGLLTVDELSLSLKVIVKAIQGHYFDREIQNIKSNTAISSGQLTQLAPFLDKDDILRVRGRLSQAELPFSQRFPIILPGNDHVVRLLYKQEHIDLHHAGPQMVLAHIRLRFWPINGLRSIKREIKSCVTCFRFKAAAAKQIMAPLPLDRVSIARPFLKVGIDFGGPIIIKESKLRKPRTYKAYFALFVCMVTKAIHIEVVTSLSSDAFLATLKRFVARRGNPQIIFSDNGTNFQGANNSLRDVYTFFKSNKNVIVDFLSCKEIRWKFIPPSSPHWGGLWEAGIKSAKFHLKRVVGSQVLTLEQLLTVLCQIEAVLNSRPLTALSTDPSDFLCLTPSHFLIGEVLTSFPERDCVDRPDNRINFWQHCEKMRQLFWKRWSVEYLNRLQHRPKWTAHCKNLKVNDLVLLKEDGTQPLDWRLGRVLEVFPGKDKNIRSVRVRTQDSVLIRPITKLCPLPFCNSLAGGEDVGNTSNNKHVVS